METATSSARSKANGSFIALAAAPYLASWVLSSISLLLYNKHLYRAGGFPFPLTLVTVHQLALGGLLWALRIVAPTNLLAQLMPGACRCIGRGELVRIVVPIALLQAVALAAQNQALQLSSAHFVVMLGAAKPVLVSLLQSAFGLLTLNRLHLQIVGAISAGVMFAVVGELQFVLAGLVALLVAQVSEGIRIVLIQKSFGGANELDAATLLSYSAPLCAFALAPAALLAEIRTMEEGIIAHISISPVAGSTALAALVNLSGVLVIQKTDALVLVLAGIVKDFVAIFVSAWFFVATVMPSQMVGYSFAVIFINVYREFKQNEAIFLSEGLCCAVVSLARPTSCMRQQAHFISVDGPKNDNGPTGNYCGKYYRHRQVLTLLLCVCLLGVSSLSMLQAAGHFSNTFNVNVR